MVLQVKTHLGSTGLVNTKYLAVAEERKWDPAKKYFRTAISDVEELNKLTTGEAGLTANSAVSDKSTEQQVREDMEEKFRELFDTLAMTATEKKGHHRDPDQDNQQAHQKQLGAHRHHQESHQPTREGSKQERAKRQHQCQ